MGGLAASLRAADRAEGSDSGGGAPDNTLLLGCRAVVVAVPLPTDSAFVGAGSGADAQSGGSGMAPAAGSGRGGGGRADNAAHTASAELAASAVRSLQLQVSLRRAW